MRIHNALTEKPQTVWTGVMLIILKENYESMTDLELGNTIGVSKGSVRQKMFELGIRRPFVPKPKAPRKLPQKTIEQQAAHQKKKEAEKVNRTNEQIKSQSRMRENALKVTSRQVDYTQKRMIKVDGKTWIYVDGKTWIYVEPGQDEDALKKKYTRTYSKGQLDKIAY
ncbi:MAG TPA: hypothetical protein VK618_06745 [Flavitalea sp.]|nr:hypothetical protein [Flavitalea sp.]